MADGVLPAQTIRAMIADGTIAADPEVRPEQVQPASLDLRLGSVACGKNGRNATRGPCWKPSR